MIKSPGRSLRLLLLAAVMSSAQALAQGGAGQSTDLQQPMSDSAMGDQDTGAEGDTILDESHRYLSTRADDLAIYLDEFFGSPITDVESADTNLRATVRYDWDDDDGNDLGFRLRGKVDLPRINKRLALIFNGEEGDFDGGYGDDSSDGNTAGLQYNSYDSNNSRLDLTLSASCCISLKPGVRYRYQNNLGENSRFRGLTRLQYEEDEGFYNTTQLDLDRLVTENSIVRWSSKVTYGEETQGVEWRSVVHYRMFRSDKSAWGVVGGATGVTDAEDENNNPTGKQLTKAYGVGLRYRQRVWRDWFFVELQPGYIWRKRHPEDDRHGVFQIRINFEIWLNRGRELRLERASID